MKTFNYIWCFLQFSLVTCLSITQKRLHLAKRLGAKSNELIGCVQMVGEEGHYVYESLGSNQVCGLYVIAKPDQLVKIEFTHFNVQCHRGGLVAVVDGWEAQGQFFPSEFDSEIPLEDRYSTLCGQRQIEEIYVSSQNVALIQSRIPSPGQGFSVTISFIKNMQPCNVVSMYEAGTMTISNFGMRRNCSVSIIYPQKIRITEVDVAQSTRYPPLPTPKLFQKFLQNRECDSQAEDYVELLDGSGLDPSYMWQDGVLCGLHTNSGPATYYLGCSHSVVRLVSSGNYFNSVTFKHMKLNALEEKLLAGLEC